jgi:hypothetical protein
VFLSFFSPPFLSYTHFSFTSSQRSRTRNEMMQLPFSSTTTTSNNQPPCCCCDPLTPLCTHTGNTRFRVIGFYVIYEMTPLSSAKSYLCTSLSLSLSLNTPTHIHTPTSTPWCSCDSNFLPSSSTTHFFFFLSGSVSPYVCVLVCKCISLLFSPSLSFFVSFVIVFGFPCLLEGGLMHPKRRRKKKWKKRKEKKVLINIYEGSWCFIVSLHWWLN